MDFGAADTLLLQTHLQDSTFRAAVVAQLLALPNPPRTSFFSGFGQPRPYVKGEYSPRSGFDAQAGVCVGGGC